MADEWPGRPADDATWPGSPLEGGVPEQDPYLNTPSSFKSLGRGVAQAGMNLIEGPAKLAADVGIPVPRPQWAVDLKHSVDKDLYARGAEIAGGIATGFAPVSKIAQATGIPRLIGEYAPTISSLAGRAMAPVSRTWEAIGPAGRGAVIAPLTSPATGEHPWRERAEQAAGGALLGKTAGSAVAGVQARKAAEAAYAQEKAAWDAANQARQSFQPFDKEAANVDWYRHTLDALGPGEAAKAPTPPGPEALLQIRNTIGGKLDETAEHMSFYPDEGTLADLWNAPHGTDLIQRHPNWPADFRRIVTEPLRATKLDDGTIELGRGMSGRQYGDYISSIRQAADKYARSARGPMGSDPDRLAMAQELRHAIEAIEEAADAPPGIKEARGRARLAYRRWAIGDDAAKVGAGDIATPSNLLKEMDRRMSRGEYVSDPMRQRVEEWRRQAETRRPPAPGAEPQPPTQPAPGRTAQLVAHLAPYAAGHAVGHAIGDGWYLPYLLGTASSAAFAPSIGRLAGAAGRAGQFVGRFPQSPRAAAIAGGQLGPSVDPTLQALYQLWQQIQ